MSFCCIFVKLSAPDFDMVKQLLQQLLHDGKFQSGSIWLVLNSFSVAAKWAG
jgi:hypothetical protein